MSHIDYNYLYYFWHVYREDFVIGAAETLYLTPQIITGQIRALEERLQGKLFRRKGHGLRPSELGELIYHYANKTFALGQGMLDVVSYHKESNLLFDVGVIDALSKRLASSVLGAAAMEDEWIHLRCFESTHEMFLEQLSQHKLDMIISGCPIGFTQQERLFSIRASGCGVSFQCVNPLPGKPFPACLEGRRLLIPGRRSMLGCKLLSWFSSQGLNVEALGESDDVALVKAFGATYNAIFVAPSLYTNDSYDDDPVVEVGCVESTMEEYHVIFAERMIQYPAVQYICNVDHSALLIPVSK